MTEHLRVDRIACTGHGLCGELAPEVVEMDDWGYPIVRVDPIPLEAYEHAARAVKACPAVALRIERKARTGLTRRT